MKIDNYFKILFGALVLSTIVFAINNPVQSKQPTPSPNDLGTYKKKQNAGAVSNPSKAKEQKKRSSCTIKNSQNCTNDEIKGNFAEDPETWGMLFEKVSIKECDSSDKDGCVNLGNYYNYLDNLEMSRDAFKRACELGDKESCCNEIWMRDLKNGHAQTKEEFSKTNKEFLDNSCLDKESIDSLVLWTIDRSDRNNDLEQRPEYYKRLFAFACKLGSSLGCSATAYLMSEMGEPYALTAPLYQIACKNGDLSSCGEARIARIKSGDKKYDFKGNPDLPLGGNYTINMGKFRTSNEAEYEAAVYTSLGFWTVINEVASSKFLVMVGKFKTSAEAKKFIQENKEIERHYEYISQFK